MRAKAEALGDAETKLGERESAVAELKTKLDEVRG
jgi:hypothetical protein